MTVPQSCRVLACPVAESREWWECVDREQQRGQDKSRNVRPVGWGGNSSDFGYLAHIAPAARTLPTCATPRICSVIHTLRATA